MLKKKKSLSGKKITASQLKIGKAYLYYLGYKYATIQSISGTQLVYKCSLGLFGSCSKNHFARRFPSLITKTKKLKIDLEEKDFLSKR